jgi:hypothetical protein
MVAARILLFIIPREPGRGRKQRAINAKRFIRVRKK